MFAQLTRKGVVCLVLAAVVMALAGAFLARTASAGIQVNTVDAVAQMTGNGRHLLVTGPIGCTAGERAHIRVTVTQRTTGAVAEGHTLVRCAGDTQQWAVRASTRGRETFEEGPAVAVALARTTAGGVATDTHQWLVAITLQGE
jgi:hypothetical protein